MKIYTRTGDTGKTSLYDGTRVNKDDIRVESYGTLDELNSYLGLCALYAENADKKILRDIQLKLFSVSGELATKKEGVYKNTVSEDDVKKLEDIIDRYVAKTDDVNAFIVPGTNLLSAHMHVARTICRRAERKIFTLSQVDTINPLLIKYINRLSDAIYAIARFNETELNYVNF